MAFSHLHVHDTYSLLDGYGLPEVWAQQAAEQGMVALGQTNHGTISGHVAHHYACKKEGIHPVYGNEFYIAKDMNWRGLTEEQEADIKLKSSSKAEADKMRKELTKDIGEMAHLLVLAMNDKGYENLRALVSLSHLSGFYRKPRIDYPTLLKHKEGLFVSTACLAGSIPKRLRVGDYETAKKAARLFKERLGENFALEIMPLDMDEQRTVNLGLVKISKELGIPLIATNDAHYVEDSHAWAQEILVAIGTRKTMDDEKRLKFGGGELFLRTEDQMRSAFKKQHPEIDEATIQTALDFSYDIAFKCDADPLRSRADLPQFTLPEGQTSNDEYLRFLCAEGWKKKGITKWPAESRKTYGERVKYELGILRDKGFANYFLITWDLVRWAKDRGIAVGPARGSAAGSLVAYLLSITDIDPIRFELSFERFIAPHRTDYPDIDIDFEDARRGEVKNYVSQKYGEENVANVATFNTLRFRSAFRDAARVFRVPEQEVSRAIGYFDTDGDSDDVIETDTVTMRKFNERYPDVLKAAKALNGQLRSGGTHAAGIVLSDRPLSQVTAMELHASTPVVALTKDEIEALGLVKIDILGLKTMSVLSWALRRINERRVREELESLTLESITTSLNDERIFREFAAGNTEAVFQFNKPGGRRLCQELRVSEFGELAAVNALDRPGPLQSGGTALYVQRKDGAIQHAVHPIYEEVTKDTYGVLIYQEQVMTLCRELAGLDWANVHKIRKAIAKSHGAEALEEFWNIFRDGATQQCKERTARWIWDQIVTHGGYSFNKSHAVSYAAIGYACMWMKVYYPAEFLCAVMRYGTDAREAVLEARRRTIKVKEPDVNKSGIGYTLHEDGIYAGIDAVKGVGPKAAEAVVEARGESEFKDYLDFCKRIKKRTVHKGIIRSLIEVGAFEAMHRNTGALLEFHKTRDSGASLFLPNELPKELNQRAKISLELLTKRVTLLPFTPEKHPALEFKEVLKKLDKLYPKRSQISELRAAGRMYARNEIRTITTLLSKFQIRVGDMGMRKKMALLTVEDESGEIIVRMDPKRFALEVDQFEFERSRPLVIVVSPISEYRADVREIADLNVFQKGGEDADYLTESMDRLLDAPGRVVAPLREAKHRPLKRAPKTRNPTVLGLALRVWEGNTKNGPMGFVDMADETDQQLVLIWPKSWPQIKEILEEEAIFEACLGTTKDRTLCCDVTRGHYFRKLGGQEDERS